MGADRCGVFRAALWETSLGNVSGEAHPRDVGWSIAGFLKNLLRDIKTSGCLEEDEDAIR